MNVVVHDSDKPLYLIDMDNIPSNGTAPPAAIPLGMDANVWPT